MSKNIPYMKILITGGAGFIGSHLTSALLADGNYELVGLDNLNHYYDVNLKLDRLKLLGISIQNIPDNELLSSSVNEKYQFVKLDLTDKQQLFQLFERERFDYVVNLAAQPGVRYSLENPDVYIQSNVIGFLNVLEACRNYPVKHLIYASSSSVYGLNGKVPFSVHDDISHPVSLYAATKKSNELMAHTYSHLFQIPVTGLRFFTVYGPYGRPDMSPSLFAHAIFKGEPLKIFNFGKMRRDFTYVDDIVNGIIPVITHIPQANPNWDKQSLDPASSSAPYAIYNIGNQTPVMLMDYIRAFEKAIGKEAVKEYLPMQPGDVVETYSDMTEMIQDFNYLPKTTVEEGVQKFVDWFKVYYHYEA